MLNSDRVGNIKAIDAALSQPKIGASPQVIGVPSRTAISQLSGGQS